MKSNRTVSVVLPTYNRGHLLPRAMDSVVAQTYPRWELIVVDDGSTDDTESVVRRYRARFGDRVIYLRQDRAGASVARNAGMERAAGQWIAFLDSDDAFKPGKLDRQVALFARRPELGLVFCDMAVQTLDGTHHPSRFDVYAPLMRAVPCEGLGDDLHVCPQDFVDYLVRDYLIPTITGMVHRDMVEAGVRFAPEQSYSEEWLFFLDVASRRRCGYVDASLAVQYCQPGSVSQRSVTHNLAQQERVLRWIQSTYPRVTRDARRAIGAHLASCCRQLGFDAYKQDHFAAAWRHFLDAWRAQPDARHAGYVIQALWARGTQWVRRAAGRGDLRSRRRAGGPSTRQWVPFSMSRRQEGIRQRVVDAVAREAGVGPLDEPDGDTSAPSDGLVATTEREVTRA
jgi:glycosyltransferase involved in cell wall biosynthesis